MPEWSNGPHSKCGVLFSVPKVRILSLPQRLSSKDEKFMPRRGKSFRFRQLLNIIIMQLKEIKNFFLHLRLNYQIFILSGAYLLGGVLSPQTSQLEFFLQFFTIHILLFGGVTAYNSYYDKDEGPIGGLKNPPKMKPWMLYASWILQITGLLLSFYSGFFFLIAYSISMFSFWAYSSPITRLKGKPILSLIAIGVTIICSFFMGYFTHGGDIITITQLIPSIGASLLVLGVYPVSQIYQIAEDKKRNDITFTVKFGLSGVLALFSILFPMGTILVFSALYKINKPASLIFIFIGLIAGLINFFQIKSLKGIESEYDIVMKMKYVSGILFSIFLIILIILF